MKKELVTRIFERKTIHWVRGTTTRINAGQNIISRNARCKLINSRSLVIQSHSASALITNTLQKSIVGQNFVVETGMSDVKHARTHLRKTVCNSKLVSYSACTCISNVHL